MWKVQRASCSVSASLHLQIVPWFLNLISYVLCLSYISYNTLYVLYLCPKPHWQCKFSNLNIPFKCFVFSVSLKPSPTYPSWIFNPAPLPTSLLGLKILQLQMSHTISHCSSFLVSPCGFGGLCDGQCNYRTRSLQITLMRWTSCHNFKLGSSFEFPYSSLLSMEMFELQHNMDGASSKSKSEFQSWWKFSIKSWEWRGEPAASFNEAWLSPWHF